MAQLLRAWESLSRLLYPDLCWLCRGTAQRGVCAGCCFEADAASAPRCRLCALRLPAALTAAAEDERLCAACRRDAPPFRGAVCLGDYSHAGADAGPVRAAGGGASAAEQSPRPGAALREWILAFKHGARPELARRLGWSLAREARRLPLPAGIAVTSVPLHYTRRFERGYDQGRLLGQAVAEALGVAFVPALRRTRATPPQGSPGAAGRAENVRGAFRRDRDRSAPAWLLVDDVGTSLATAREAARALGADRGVPVYLALLARAELRHRALTLASDREPPP